jgi:Uri superfamily endonuclease
MDGGTYTIVLKLEAPTTIEFGAAGKRGLDTGLYAYTGSAFGPGGLSRIDRHRRVYRGESDTRHWHIDYLLGAPETSWVDVRTTPADAECEIARALPGEPIPGIGASDCRCVSHLTAVESRDRFLEAIEWRYGGQSTATHSDGD